MRHFDYLGPDRYFLTFCTHDRQPHFGEASNVALVSAHFLMMSVREGFEVPAYCFMPDHVHLLVEGNRPDSDLQRFIKSAKQYSGFYFAKKTNQRLWQRYGFERALRSDEATTAVARYIIENPVRAALVRAPHEYPHWGSFIYSREQLLEFVERAT